MVRQKLRINQISAEAKERIFVVEIGVEVEAQVAAGEETIGFQAGVEEEE